MSVTLVPGLERYLSARSFVFVLFGAGPCSLDAFAFASFLLNIVEISFGLPGEAGAIGAISVIRRIRYRMETIVRRLPTLRPGCRRRATEPDGRRASSGPPFRQI